ncbi:hypothetical protein BKA70DRAFT_1120446 [Coprinopsis sp. MPI-PUGE-AT-0042]|nr:hypothetical protein BKA70DRAFT_1120350 [Coprinopsis sp. MPI-PUGE-AT-0042]KAH6890717.1 hypothetical protein BKA70DRAFT_1120446 [Coprinopsis sp. MPI-PUGE-AT-0042]
MLIAPGKRKRKSEAHDYDPPPEDDIPPATHLEEHTVYSHQSRSSFTTFLNVPASPSKSARKEPPAQASSSGNPDWGDGFGDINMEGVEDDGEERDTCSTGRRATEDPLLGFKPLLDLTISEILRHEAPGLDNGPSCSMGCSVLGEKGAFRCRDCFVNPVYCRSCMVVSHQQNPLHWIEMWNGSYFERSDLKSLGLRVQLHHPGCPNPDCAFNNEFVVLHSNGIHTIGLDFCNCAYAPTHYVQLLRHRLFPATTSQPKTAATFDVLQAFQLLSFTAKVNVYDFHHALVRRTNNTGTRKVPDRYNALLCIVHVWRHVRCMKRHGRGHDPSGVQGTRPGECAVRCPACPYPKINLPANYENCLPSERFLYQLFIAVDANFRLKRKDVSSDLHDPGLNNGYAYFVPETEFKEFLKQFVDLAVGNNGKSNCNNYDAIKSASIRGGRGNAASGLGAAQCARHDMKRALGVGDLQRGEKYPNMDFLVIYTITADGPVWIVLSYDIACQWSINFAACCERYGPRYHDPFKLGHSFQYLVPKFHLPAHILACQVAYSFNYHPGVGRTEGEAPERGWADSNGLAYSTREMGPGSRRDTLDDHFGAVNWMKITKLAETFACRATEAVTRRQEQVDAFKIFDRAIPADKAVEWSDMVEAWEDDSSEPNPFMPSSNILTSSAVCLRLAAEDAKAVKEGRATVVHEDVTPSMFILQGIEIEEAHLNRSKVIEQSSSLQRKIDSWVSLQNSFMPPTVALRQAVDKQARVDEGPEHIPLFLPSSLCIHVAKFDRKLFACEQEYRVAQAETTLHQLRGLILLRTHMHKSKARYGSGHRYMTRSNSLLSDVNTRIAQTAERYRLARSCLVQLATVTGNTSWANSLKELAQSDVRGLTDEDEGGEGQKKLKWIWTTPGTTDDQEESTQSALQIEWCKARARAHRWQEECLLLAEEMRRVLAFWEWEAVSWEEKAGRYSEDEPDIESKGRVAYASKQASIRRQLILYAKNSWSGLDLKLKSLEGQAADELVRSCHV